MDMDISMDIHVKSVDMDMDMDEKIHIHGNPEMQWRSQEGARGQLLPNCSLVPETISFKKIDFICD